MPIISVLRFQETQNFASVLSLVQV